MKKLRKALALVLAIVMLVSVVPFAAVADAPDATFTVAKLNGTDYDGTTPIVSGDTIDVDITLTIGAEEVLKAWMLGYAFDTDALTYGGTTFAPIWNGTSSDKGTYILVGGSIKTSASASGTELVVATITFTVNSAFSGLTAILAGQGTRNYFSIGETTIQRKDVTAQGCEFTVYAPVDKTALKAKLDEAAELDEDDYTPRSWAALPGVVSASQAVYDDAFALQTEIDAATQNLADAIDALVEVGNKFQLTTAVNNARIEAAKDCYTPDSLANLNAAIAAAQIVLDDDNATQPEIDAQTVLVKQAIKDLVLNNVTVRFMNADGSVFDEQSVPFGGSATVPATNPVKAADNYNTYTFVSWSGNYTNVTSSVDIIPVFSSTPIDYTVTFTDENDVVISSNTYHYGDTVVVPEDPTKAEDNTYTYEFAGWSPEVTTVSGDITYKATFTATYKEYTITFVNYNDAELAKYTLHWGDTVTAPADPAKEQDDTYTYEFAGWDKDVVAVAGDATYKAEFTPVYREYTVTFYNGEEVVSTKTDYHWGDEVVLPEDPSKAADDTYTYTFAGWSPEVTAVAGNAEYYAQFTPNYIDYSVKFVDYDDSEIASYTLHWGDTVTPPADPTRAADETYTYEFAGWDPTVNPVSGDITYKATYTPTYIDYTIKFVNYDDSELATLTLHWGDEVTPPADPSKPADAQYTYTFSGWDKDVVAVAGDATYKAVYSEAVNQYKVTFLNYDQSLFAEVMYDYGTTPTDPEGTPVKPDDETFYYVFTGWAPEFTPVEGEQVYTAQFDPFYLEADYTAVKAAVDEAMKYQDSDSYTSTSYNRLFAAVAAVDYTLTIDQQDQVDAYAAAILDAIDKLVSTTAYDAFYQKCADVNNDNNQYTVDSFNAFETAFAALGAKKDFNTEEATQAQVDAALSELEGVYALLEAASLTIEGADEYLENDEIKIKSNTNSDTTSLEANDGGAGTASLVFTDAKGAVITSETKSLGTGTKVELVQGGEVKLTKYVVVYGDINGDGQVSIADIRLAKKMAVSTDGFTAYQIAAAKCGGADVDVAAVIALASAI